MDRTQVNRFSKAEIELIQNTFGGKNDDLLYQLRDVFYGFSDKKLPFVAGILEIIEKAFLPKLSNDVPLNVQADIFLYNFPLEQLLPEMAFLQVEARDVVEEYIQDRLNVLHGLEGTQTLFDLKQKGEKSEKERLVDLLAYQYLAKGYFDFCLQSLKNWARPPETEEEKKKKATANSSK